MTTAPKVVDKATRLGTEAAFSTLARARALERAGHDVIHLELGEPDFRTPPHIVDAAIAALRAGDTHYCQTAGIPPFREAIAEHMSRTRAVSVPAERVLVGNGAKPFLLFTILAVSEPGDEVVYPVPGFPIYESAIRWAGATPVPLPIREDNNFSFCLDDLATRLNPRTKLVILNSPHNPTGGVTPPSDLAAAAELILRTPAWVLSDEVYSRIVYDEGFASIATFPDMLDRTVVLDGLSKTYAMTGWRCGYVAAPDALVEPLTRLLVNSTSCVPPFVQRAGIAALTGPQHDVAAMVQEFRARRDLLVDALGTLPGVRCHEPRGAFYVFANVSEVPLPSDVLADRLLTEAGVAVLPGSAFGSPDSQYLRLSYANSRENIARAVARMAGFLARDA